MRRAANRHLLDEPSGSGSVSEGVALTEAANLGLASALLPVRLELLVFVVDALAELVDLLTDLDHTLSDAGEVTLSEEGNSATDLTSTGGDSVQVCLGHAWQVLLDFLQRRHTLLDVLFRFTLCCLQSFLGVRDTRLNLGLQGSHRSLVNISR